MIYKEMLTDVAEVTRGATFSQAFALCSLVIPHAPELSRTHRIHCS